MEKKLIYNSDIDGLRAIAVVAVVLFHAGAPLFSYGYLGVDVFFVISGYLITNYIIEERKLNNFSLITFYEKRIRRIAPALLVLMIVVTPFAWIFLLPDHLENFGQSLVATVLYANNILLYLTSNYWDHRSELKPLLHTWSLGVEVQFYIFYPVILCMLGKFVKDLKKIVLGLFLISAIYYYYNDAFSEEAKFYLLQFRLYEFLLGGVVAVFSIYAIRNNVLVCLGFLLILLSVLNFSGDNYFFIPEVKKYSSLLGATLIIYFSNGGVGKNSIFGAKYLAGIGVISYSIYLIHQPIYAFIRAISSKEVGYQGLILATPVIFLLSYFNWKFVEIIFRSSRQVQARIFFPIIIACSVLVGAFGFYLNNEKGLPDRFGFGDVESLSDISIDYNERIRKLRKNPTSNLDVNTLIVGDSFSRDFGNILIESKAVDIKNIAYYDFDLDDCKKIAELSKIFKTFNIKYFYISYQKFRATCHEEIVAVAKNHKVYNILFIGPKSFGENMNFLSIIPKYDWVNSRVKINKSTTDIDSKLKIIISKELYISLTDVINYGEMLTAVTDVNGNLISLDGEHLTRHGAKYLACMLDINGFSEKIHEDFDGKNGLCERR